MLKTIEIHTTRGAIVSGVSLFVFGTLFWSALAYHSYTNFKGVQDSEARIHDLEQKHWFQAGETDTALEANFFKAKVIKVHDGDTMTVEPVDKPDTKVVIRFEGMDAPEWTPPRLQQPYGDVAAKQASDWALNKEVTIEPSGNDRYGRTIALIRLPDGTILNDRMVKAGLAWVYMKYPHPKAMEGLQAEAKANKKGLWADPNPEPPWQYRAEHRPKPKPSTAKAGN